MEYGRPKVSSSTATAQVIPDEYYAMGARYADRRGRAGAMASLNQQAISIASFSRNSSSSAPVEVLYPGTAKLSGGLLTSLIRSPDLDLNYVQRFQHIAIIAQLADAILTVAQATGKYIVPVEFDDSTDTDKQAGECSCNDCTEEKKRNESNINGNASGSECGCEKQKGSTDLQGRAKEKENEKEMNKEKEKEKGKELINDDTTNILNQAKGEYEDKVDGTTGSAEIDQLQASSTQSGRTDTELYDNSRSSSASLNELAPTCHH